MQTYTDFLEAERLARKNLRIATRDVEDADLELKDALTKSSKAHFAMHQAIADLDRAVDATRAWRNGSST